MNEMPLICASKLSLIRGERQLFHSMSFSLCRGQAIHLCGKNGSGKTSLLKLLIGGLSPTEGRLLLLGKTFEQFEPEDYQKILYIGHQTPIKLNLTVGENIILNAQLTDALTVSAEEIENALKAVGLWRFYNQPAKKLSEGQKRRLFLARLWLVFSHNKSHKKIWLLDEPLTALDSDFIDLLQQHISAYLASGGALVFTSHQPLRLQREIQLLKL